MRSHETKLNPSSSRVAKTQRTVTVFRKNTRKRKQKGESLAEDSMSFSHPYAYFSVRPISSGSTRLSTSVAATDFKRVRSDPLVLYNGGSLLCQKFWDIKLWIMKNLNLKQHNRKHVAVDVLKMVSNHNPKNPSNHYAGKTHFVASQHEKATKPKDQTDGSPKVIDSADSSRPSLQKHPLEVPVGSSRGASLCIAVIGATGELARQKIFPALFALYYSGFLPEDVGVFGYSRKNLTDDDLRSIIASTLTCRIDNQHNCDEKMSAFLSRTYYLNGGCDNREGMSRLNDRMKQIEDTSRANRIFYLSVPQEAVMDVACSLADNAQTERGWNRIIIEKPFGFDSHSSHQLTNLLLSKFEEKQIYRIDHLLGRNLIENLTVLRFSNLVFEPLWSRTYIRNIQVILSESSVQKERYLDGFGIIRDIVHSHIFQTIALLAMEPSISLDGEDIRNEKVKVLRSIRRLEPSDIILGQYKSSQKDKVGLTLNSLSPTYCAAALYIDNGRWDGVPFLIKVGTGLIKHRVEIRIQFRHVPGNLYRERLGHNLDLATNELILRDEPEESILVKINNKIPGLGLQLDASELNLLYKDRYNTDVPDSYEQLILDVIDGDNHLFMRSDEVAAAWNILTPIVEEINKKNIAPELYEFGGRGPVGAYYLWAKHAVQWAED